MFLKFILRALQYRKQRLLLAFSALAIAAALATVMFGVYGSVERRIRGEFSGYGANLIAAPAQGNTVPAAIREASQKLGAEAAAFLVTTAEVDGEAVPMVAFDTSDDAVRMTSYWHVKGTREIHTGECLAGELLANKAKMPCVVRGVVSTGAAEDRELLVPLGDVRDVSFVEIRAPGERVDAIRAELASKYPEVDFRTVRSVADTESNVVLKVRAALFLLTLVILGITTLCVSSNFSEMVMERSKEIGIMKALGAAERRIAAFFVSESAALALGATVVGYVCGVLAAAAIGTQIFGGAFHPQADWSVFVIVAAVMLGVAAVATGVAALRIWGIQPAITLRGE